MPRVARAATLTLAISATIIGLSAVPAAADDAHQACARTVLCTGNLVDVHDVTTHLIAPILSVIG